MRFGSSVGFVGLFCALTVIGGGDTSARAAEKITLCHYQEAQQSWKVLSLNEAAAANHLANHDDARPGGTTPSGVQLSEECEPTGSPGALKFSSAQYEVLEDAGVAIITIERSTGSEGDVSIDYRTSDDSALDGADYTGVSGTMTWYDGDSNDKTFTVPVLDDDEEEGEETVRLALSNPTGGASVDPQLSSSVLAIQASDGG